MTSVIVVDKAEKTARNLTVQPGTVVVLLDQKAQMSSTGKMLLIGCTNGNKETECEVEADLKGDGKLIKRTVWANCNIGVYVAEK